MSNYTFMPFNNQSTGMVNSNIFPHVVDTSMPPPNFAAARFQPVMNVNQVGSQAMNPVTAQVPPPVAVNFVSSQPPPSMSPQSVSSTWNGNQNYSHFPLNHSQFIENQPNQFQQASSVNVQWRNEGLQNHFSKTNNQLSFNDKIIQSPLQISGYNHSNNSPSIHSHQSDNGWNASGLMQKTNMPNLSIFNNPDAIFSINKNNPAPTANTSRDDFTQHPFPKADFFNLKHSNEHQSDMKNINNYKSRNTFSQNEDNYVSKRFKQDGAFTDQQNKAVQNANLIDVRIQGKDNQDNGISYIKKEPEFHSRDTQKRPHWMTESIQSALKKRNALYMEARNTNDPATWEQYNTLKEQINQEIRNNSYNNNKRRYNSWNDGNSKAFSCDMCDRSFSTEEEYKSHCDLHITCHYDGCNFKAHPKVVALHQKMQHETGYADAINKLQNDEEIKKWREERKKHFPTAANILKRKAEQAEREARGEVVENKNFGKFNMPKFERPNFRNQGSRRGRNNRRRGRYDFKRNASEMSSVQDESDSEEDDCHIKLPKFLGMKNAVSLELNCEIEGDNEEGPDEIPIEKDDSSHSLDEVENVCLSAEEDNEITTGEIQILVTDQNESNGEETKKENQSNVKKQRKDFPNKRPNPKIHHKNSLLEMLLDGEIRHERNVIMQCIRHIVRNDFFKKEDNLSNNNQS